MSVFVAQRPAPTKKGERQMERFLVVLVTGVLLIPASAAHASSPEEACQNGRYSAAAKYGACEQKATGKFLAGGPTTQFEDAVSKCRAKYMGTWAKLAMKAAGTATTCDTTRFTDNGSTLTDNLTGLEWEKKTSDATIHSEFNPYSWSAGGSAADGSAFTTFLSALNSGGCFAGQCDWRLPTIYELQTILAAAYPCTTAPCIDPVFGPTAGFYWSATSFVGLSNAWGVDFSDANVFYGFGGKYNNFYVRAVRGGL